VLRGIAAVAVPPSLLVISRPRAGQRVALTFDDGPDSLTGAYLDQLDALEVRATFFLVGARCASRPWDTAEIARRGHELGSHGYTHVRFPAMSSTHLTEELEQTLRVLPAGSGQHRRVRPPGGAVDLRTLVCSIRAGYTTVLWSVDSEDARVHRPSEIADAVSNRVGPGDIVLFHEGQLWTLEALPSIVQRLRRRGLLPCTVDELLTRR
jgi:peptidoglycan-N-acetylglucosamine deacetylase